MNRDPKNDSKKLTLTRDTVAVYRVRSGMRMGGTTVPATPHPGCLPNGFGSINIQF